MWSELSELPEHFVLYGGTAIALCLGGRQSVDFDFFTNQPISADSPSAGLSIPTVEDNGVFIASLLDLAAQKMKVILVRAESKDYFDIYTLLKAGITLPTALGAAKALYPEFNPVLSLKALAYHGEPGLVAMPVEIREFLTAASAQVESIETISKIAPDISPSSRNMRVQTQSKSI